MKLTAIQLAIADIEREHAVRVLYAAESGSRAWGFASPDSDYDVRFICAHPRDWYLRVDQPRDVIEAMLPGDLDLSGWDLKKALGLFAGCNLALNEWLHSPIVYADDGALATRLRKLESDFFRPAHALFHYLNTARSTRSTHLRAPAIRLKKMFYALRPLLACRWIEHQRSQPPTAFGELVAALWVSDDERAAIAELQTLKHTASEAHRWTITSEWNDWLDRQEQHFEEIGARLGEKRDRPTGVLNDLMRHALV